MATNLVKGQLFTGKFDSYTLINKIRTSIWRAKPSNNASTHMLLKFGPASRLQCERDALRLFPGHHAFRQPLNEIQEPSGLALEYLDGDLLSASNAKQLERYEI
jgi:hypothetical protein